MTLSVTVIVKNEEKWIRPCLESAVWADEIIVLDSGSTDRTVEICGEFPDKVFETDWPGYGPQKNRALQRASGDWVFSLDADERISAELRSEILSTMADPGDYVAFKCPRLSNYCGRYMRHSGWWPDYVTRLFRRGHAAFSDDLVHERLVVEGEVGRLGHPLIHEAFPDLEEVLGKVNSYSSAGACMMHRRMEKGSLWRALSHGLWSFIHTYITRLGFLDGREGFMLAVSNAEGTYYRYLKLMLLNEKK